MGKYKIDFKEGNFRMQFGCQVERIPAKELTAQELIARYDKLTAAQQPIAIELELTDAPASRARTCQVILGLIAKAEKIDVKNV